MGVDNLKEWVEKFLKGKVGVECKVKHSRLSGKVIILRLGKEEEKKEVMKNKNKLKGGNIFIENDLTWEERKLQEKIGKWAKEERNKGREIKMGLGKIRINRIWKFWTEIGKEMEERKERMERESGDREEERKNFM